MTAPQNQIVPFANGAGANAQSPSDYLAQASLLQNGFVAGTAKSAQFNALMRQLSTVASGLAQFVADNQSQDVLDDGSPTNFEAKFEAALAGFSSVSQLHFAVATGNCDAMVATFSPKVGANSAGGIPAGTALIVLSPSTANTTTNPQISVDALGSFSIVGATGAAVAAGDVRAKTIQMLVSDGTSLRRIGLSQSEIVALVGASGGVAYGVDTSAVSGTVTVNSLSPAISSLADGKLIAIDIANLNPGSTLNVTLPINGNPTGFQASRVGGLSLRSGDVVAGGQALFIALGGRLQLINGQAIQSFFTRTLSPGGTTRNITPADSNGMFYVYAPGGVAQSTTLNLPNASTMPYGIVSAFYNASGNGITMTINSTPTNGANYILLPPIGVSQIVLQNSSSYVTFYSDGGNWLVIGCSPDVGSNWGKVISTGTNGVKRADGIIENWGVLTVGPNSSQTFALLYPYAVQGYPQATAQVNATGVAYAVHAVMASNSQLTISNPNGATLSIGWRVTGT